MSIIGVMLSSILSIVAIFIITKLIGHKQISQFDFFDYVCGITIGSIAAELATELEAPLEPLIALAVYGAASVALSLLTHKLPRTRKFINGSPTILMNDGKLYRENIKKSKLDLSEFMIMCREQGYFDLSQIQTAIYEYDGKLSILPRPSSRPLTPSDMQITANATHIGVELIMDGRIMGENLRRLGRDVEWLSLMLKSRGYRSARSVFLAVYREEDGSLQIYPNEKISDL